MDDVGVWYVLPGNDKIVNVEISTTGITRPKIAVFSGLCGNLTCVTSLAGRTLSWEGKLGTEYRVLLTGNAGEISFTIQVRYTATPLNTSVRPRLLALLFLLYRLF